MAAGKGLSAPTTAQYRHFHAGRMRALTENPSAARRAIVPAVFG
ncbi:MAG: hypothetical protein ACREQE_10150 [Candidatus Binataceae bacterium]